MKWGQVIKENVLWKWRTRYISYEILKQIIKTLSSNSAENTKENVSKLKSKFGAIVETDLSKVESFFNHQQQKLIKQSETLLIYWNKINLNDNQNNHIIFCLINGFTKLLALFNELNHYAFINAEGFRKIIKKYDKRLSTNIKSTYYPLFKKCSFYKHEKLKLKIAEINKIIQNTTHDEIKDNQIFENNKILNELLAYNETNETNDISEWLETATQNEKISQLFIHSIRSNKYETIDSIMRYCNVQNQDDKMLKKIINKRGYLGNTALMTCCSVSGSTKIANLLIKYGADVTLRNDYQRNVVHSASQKGHIELIRIFLNMMKNDKMTKNLFYELDKDMNNPLHLACLRRQYAASQLLIEFDSIIVNAANADGVTPLMIVCGDGGSETEQDINTQQQLVRILLKHSKNINQRDWKLKTALHYACNSGNEPVIDVLLNHKIDPFVFDYNGQSPLHIASNKGYLGILTKICEYCKDQTQENNNKVWQSSVPIMDHTDNKGRTPLHLCAGNGFSECAAYLLSIGADPNIKDSISCNPHSYAWHCGIWTDQCPAQNLDDEDDDKEYLEKPSDEEPTNPSVLLKPTMIKSASSPIISRLARVEPISLPLFMESPSVSPYASISTSPLKPPMDLCVVKFRIQCDTAPRQYLSIIGDCEEMGNWDVTKGLRMYRNHIPLSIQTTDDESSEVETSETLHTDTSAVDPEDITTWIGEVSLPKGSKIKYRYIVCTHSSLQSWESLPTERNATIFESMIIDDGVFGVSSNNGNDKESKSIPRHKSYQSKLSHLNKANIASSSRNQLNFDDSMRYQSPQLTGTRSIDQTLTTPATKSYVQSGWLSSSDAQLQIRLGHVISHEKRPPLVVNNNLYVDRIVIRSGYINTNRYKGIHTKINLPISEEDKSRVYKFQSNVKQIDALCSLEFEFFPRAGKRAIAKCFVLPSQILSNSTGALTLALLSNDKYGHGGLLIGEFNFEYTLITPFKHEQCGNILHKTFAQRPAYNETILIGHRGTGSHGSAELPGPRRTHIKENTILAFTQAKSFGADFVEFDVQLTKDKIPIIYHDFVFPVSKFKIPINKIKFDELKAFNKKIKDDRKQNNTTPRNGKRRKNSTPNMDEMKTSASSDNISKQGLVSELFLSASHDPPPHRPKLKSSASEHTEIKNVKQFNSFLEDNWCSLADVFKFAPKDLGLNIEIKYPYYEELVNHGIENVVDVNEYVDEILKVVFKFDCSNRYIIFSSFHPDICIALALKQPQFPVLFLTEGGKKGHYADIRCNSLKNAIRFAKSHHLFGIVTNVKPILKAPQLIDNVHKYGLILLTYGSPNNDTNIVDLQLKYGIDGVISDHVQHIRTHLDSKHSNKNTGKIQQSFFDLAI